MAIPSEHSRQLILRTLARLRLAHDQAFEDAQLVLPTTKFFPDAIDLSEDGLTKLFRRVISHSPLPSDVPFQLVFVEDEEAASGCNSGACGPGGANARLLDPIRETEEAYLLPVDVTVVRSPVRLTATFARSVGALILAYTDEAVEDLGPDSELAATLSGFGVLLANGSNVFVKGCGGVKTHRATTLGVDELTFALAAFLVMNDLSPSLARKHLEPTQCEAFDESWDYFVERPALRTALREDLPSVMAGVVSEEKVGLLGRLFGGPREPVVPAASRKPMSDAERKQLSELRALVNDALD